MPALLEMTERARPLLARNRSQQKSTGNRRTWRENIYRHAAQNLSVKSGACPNYFTKLVNLCKKNTRLADMMLTYFLCYACPPVPPPPPTTSTNSPTLRPGHLRVSLCRPLHICLTIFLVGGSEGACAYISGVSNSQKQKRTVL